MAINMHVNSYRSVYIKATHKSQHIINKPLILAVTISTFHQQLLTNSGYLIEGMLVDLICFEAPFTKVVVPAEAALESGSNYRACFTAITAAKSEKI